MKKFSFRASDDLASRLEHAAAVSGKAVSAVVSAALEDALAPEEKPAASLESVERIEVLVAAIHGKVADLSNQLEELDARQKSRMQQLLDWLDIQNKRSEAADVA